MFRSVKQFVKAATLVFVVSLEFERITAFVPPDVSLRRHGPHLNPKTATALNIANVPKEDSSGLSYGERSRPFRRDVFGYGDWVRHRSNDRFISNLLNVFRSGVVQQLLKEVYLTTGVATFVCLYNALLVNGYDDFAGLHHDPFAEGFYVFAMPSAFFALTSPALSLLLGKLQHDRPYTCVVKAKAQDIRRRWLTFRSIC